MSKLASWILLFLFLFLVIFLPYDSLGQVSMMQIKVQITKSVMIYYGSRRLQLTCYLSRTLVHMFSQSDSF